MRLVLLSSMTLYSALLLWLLIPSAMSLDIQGRVMIVDQEFILAEVSEEAISVSHYIQLYPTLSGLRSLQVYFPYEPESLLNPLDTASFFPYGTLGAQEIEIVSEGEYIESITPSGRGCLVTFSLKEPSHIGVPVQLLLKSRVPSVVRKGRSRMDVSFSPPRFRARIRTYEVSMILPARYRSMLVTPILNTRPYIAPRETQNGIQEEVRWTVYEPIDGEKLVLEVKATSGIKLPVFSKVFIYTYPAAAGILLIILLQHWRQKGDEGLRSTRTLVLGSSNRALGVTLIFLLVLIALSIPFGIVVGPPLGKAWEEARFLDQDGDGYIDDMDWYPLDPEEWEDRDRDGIPDNSDEEVAEFMTKYTASGVYEWRYLVDGVRVFSEIDLDGDGITEWEITWVRQFGDPQIPVEHLSTWAGGTVDWDLDGKPDFGLYTKKSQGLIDYDLDGDYDKTVELPRDWWGTLWKWANHTTVSSCT